MKVKKVVLGAFHQVNPKNGTTTGIQCTSNAFICFSVVKCFYLELLWFKLYFRAQKLMLYNDFFNSGDLFFHHKCLPSDEIGNGAIFRCAGTSIAFIWNTNSVFVFDSHNRHNKCCHISGGKSVCLEFRSMEVLNFFTIKYFEYAKTTRFLQYDIQYIKIEASHTDILNIWL